MNSWYRLNLGDALLAQPQQDAVRQAISTALAQQQLPDDGAAFIRHQSEGRLHCEAMVYFSPSAATLARHFDARPCAKPPAVGLGLLAGGPLAWHSWFPEANRGPAG